MHNSDKIIEQTKDYVKELLQQDCTGHDWWHVYRVWKTAIYIAEKEKADLFIVQLAALLHDVADWKFHGGNEQIGVQTAQQFLKKLRVGENNIMQVCDIISGISFKGSKVPIKMKTLEGQVVQDADRLDAIGAIGIARTFAYGGYKGRPIYDPDVPVLEHTSFESYKNARGTTINHFYEKLLLLKDRMNTVTAKKLAEEKQFFMEDFLKRFLTEWQCHYE